MAPRDLLALLLGAGSIVAVVLLAVSEAVTSGHISADASTLFSTVLGAMIGAVAMYLGTTSNGGQAVNDQTQEPEAPAPDVPAEAPEAPDPPDAPDGDEGVTTLEDGEGEDVGPDTGA